MNHWAELKKNAVEDPIPDALVVGERWRDMTQSIDFGAIDADRIIISQSIYQW